MYKISTHHFLMGKMYLATNDRFFMASNKAVKFETEASAQEEAARCSKAVPGQAFTIEYIGGR